MAASEGPRGLDGLVTESRRADGDYSALTTLELVELMNREDAAVPLAVGAEAAPLAAALDEIVARLAGGGRLVYAGAGTSGRIAELDAEECEGTFGTSPGQVVALVAGSDAGSSAEREAAEDDSAAGRRARGRRRGRRVDGRAHRCSWLAARRARRPRPRRRRRPGARRGLHTLEGR